MVVGSKRVQEEVVMVVGMQNTEYWAEEVGTIVVKVEVVGHLQVDCIQRKETGVKQVTFSAELSP